MWRADPVDPIFGYHAVVNDTQTEGDETIVFTMGAPTGATAGATATHTVTVHD